MQTCIVCTVATVSLLVILGDAQAGQTGRYPTTYNLIDPNPSCRRPIPSGVCCVGGSTEIQCPDLYLGAGDVDVMAVHPNIQERTDYTMRNMARLFPDFYASSEWGWGGGAYAGNCDAPNTPPTQPFYFMSEAVQAARWNSFSGATEFSGCTRGDCDECADPQTSHYTCWEYCEANVWNQCGYKYRTKAMVQLLFSSNAWNDVGSEGIWGGNTALLTSSSHCGMVFNHEYNHQGIGYYPSGLTTMVGIKDTADWEDHVFAHATHFGWDRSSFTFLVQFFGGKQTDPVTLSGDVFLLYKGQMIAMEQIVANDEASSTSAFFKSYQDLTDECEPYAFVAKDASGAWWRLPEDERYYFGTVDHPDALRDGSATCAENHYWNADGRWVANGGEGLDNAVDDDNACVGCSKIGALEAVYAARDAPPTSPVTPSPTTPAPTTPAPVTPAPSTKVPTTAMPVLSTTQDLEVAAGPFRLNNQADKFTDGDRDAFAALIIEFGISPAQNVQIEILSRSRGGVKGARTTIIEYTLSSTDASALDEAVANVNEKVSEGAAYRYQDGVRRTFPFVSNEEVSLALVDEEQTDDDTLNLLVSRGASDSNFIWYVVAAAVVFVMACGVMVIALRRKRKLTNELQMAQVEEDNADPVDAEVDAEVETTLEATATSLVAENV